MHIYRRKKIRPNNPGIYCLILVTYLLSIFYWIPGSGICLTFFNKDNSYDNNDLKIRLLKINQEPKEVDFILFNEYQLMVSSGGQPVPSLSGQTIILGFYGFRYSLVRGSDELSSVLSNGETTYFPMLIYHVIKNNYYFLEGSDLSNCKIAILNESKASDISGKLFPATQNQSQQPPVWIIWDPDNQHQMPDSFINHVTIIDLGDLKKHALQIASTPTLQKEQRGSGDTIPRMTYNPPQINPAFLPEIITFTKRYLRQKGGYFKDINAEALRYSLSPSNEELIIEGIYDQSVTDGYRISLPMVSLPVDLVQDSANRREEDQDPEFNWLKQDILGHLAIYLDGQRLFMKDKSQIDIPEVFIDGITFMVIPDSNMIHVSDSKFIRGNRKQSARITLTVGFTKSSLTLRMINQHTGIPLQECNVIIDFIRSTRPAYTGKVYHARPTHALFYNHPNINYRLTIDQPEYTQPLDGKQFSGKDFLNGKTIQLNPRPAFHFYYIDKKIVNPSLADTLLALLQRDLQEHEKFLIYLSNNDQPLLVFTNENIKPQLNKALYLMSSPPQLEIEKELILNAIPLDSIPMEKIIRLNFIYNTETLLQNKGQLIEVINNELSSGIMNRVTAVTVLGDNGLPGLLLNKNYHYIKIKD